nr:MAG TPA_asm: hypothetical protein [Caudoviricetes sp.]
MSMLDLLKEKTANEKQNFLNSLRSKIATKLKNTDDKKILDAISLVEEFSLSLSVTDLVKQTSCVSKQDIVLPTEILGQGVDQIPLQKYDIIRAKIGPSTHYGVIYKIDPELNIAWVVSITSDITLNNLIPIKRSRLFKTFFVAYFHPVFLDKNNYTFCNVFDNKEEFDEAIRIIKKYYKTNFRV